MRRIRYFTACSLDGYIARPDGGIDWLFTDQDYGTAEFVAETDVAVMGRATYDQGLEIGWELAFPPGVQYYVFTTRPAEPRPGIEFVSGDEAELAARLRSRPGKDIWLIGGGDLAARFLRKGLVDELTLTVHPRILGAGIPLFAPPVPETSFEFVRSRSWSTGLVQSVYRIP